MAAVVQPQLLSGLPEDKDIAADIECLKESEEPSKTGFEEKNAHQDTVQG